MTLELTREEFQLLLNAASLAPYNQIANVLQKAITQFNAQDQQQQQIAVPPSAMNGPETRKEA